MGKLTRIYAYRRTMCSICYDYLITRARVYQELFIKLWMKENGLDMAILYLYPARHKITYNTEWL